MNARKTRVERNDTKQRPTKQTAFQMKIYHTNGSIPHLHNSDVICSVDLGILGKLLSQGRYTSLQMFSLTRVLSLNVRVHASRIQLKIRQNYQVNRQKIAQDFIEVATRVYMV